MIEPGHAHVDPSVVEHGRLKTKWRPDKSGAKSSAARLAGPRPTEDRTVAAAAAALALTYEK